MAIIETPNRLWFRDDHTAMLPFFHWLPNELAFAYSRFSERNNFRELYRDYAPSSKQHFLRRGRGMSFHEIDLAIAPVSQLQIVSSLSQFGKNARYITGDGREYKSHCANCSLISIIAFLMNISTWSFERPNFADLDLSPQSAPKLT